MRGKQTIDVTKIRRDRRWWSPVLSVAVVGWPGMPGRGVVREKGATGFSVGVVKSAFHDGANGLGVQVACYRIHGI